MARSKKDKKITETRDLTVKLTEEQRDERARKASGMREEIRVLQGEIVVYTKPRKEKIKVLDDIAAKLEHAAEEGEIIEPVPCEVRREEKRGEIHVVRLDTGEIIEKRPMDGDERQGSLIDLDEEQPKGTRSKKPTEAGSVN